MVEERCGDVRAGETGASDGVESASTRGLSVELDQLRNVLVGGSAVAWPAMFVWTYGASARAIYQGRLLPRWWLIKTPERPPVISPNGDNRLTKLVNRLVLAYVAVCMYVVLEAFITDRPETLTDLLLAILVIASFLGSILGWIALFRWSIHRANRHQPQ